MVNKRKGHSVWILQRVTGIYILAFAFVVSYIGFHSPIHSYIALKQYFYKPWISWATWGLLLSLLSHAYIGMQHVIDDYLTKPLINTLCHYLLRGTLCLYFVWGSAVLFGILIDNPL